MLECARRAGSLALASRAAVGLASALVYGPTPVSEALPRVLALRKETTNRRTEAELLMLLAELDAMRGHFTEARAFIAEARAILAEIEGATDVVLAAACRRARVALLADDPAEAEEIARVGCDELERQGLIAYLRSDVVYIVDALTAQGRLEEAEAELARAQALDDDEDDVDAIQRRERARARIELARGNVEAAESAMRTALEYVMKMEWPSEHAESWLVMAHIRLAAGRDEEARAAVSETLAIAEAKEHAVYAGRARELLDSISAAAASRVA
jgi:tetratricopeptide (TPR) repeat protein